VVAIIAILAAMLMPALANAREKARQAVCMSNLKQIGLTSMFYTQDYGEWLVPARLVTDIPGIKGATDGHEHALMPEQLAGDSAYSVAIGQDYGLRMGPDLGCSIAAFAPEKGCPSETGFACTEYLPNTMLHGLEDLDNPGQPHEDYRWHKMSEVTNASDAISVVDNGANSNWMSNHNSSEADTDIGYRHSDKTNVLYLDGHVEAKSFQELSMGGWRNLNAFIQGYENPGGHF